MKIQEIIDAIVADSKYLAHYVEIQNISTLIKIYTIHSWMIVGNTETTVEEISKYVVMDFGTDDEMAYEDTT